MLLALSLLLSTLTVFSFAEGDGQDEEEPEVNLIINRGFEEGWELSNGLGGAPKGHLFEFDYEQTYDFNYNYFIRVTAQNDSDGFYGLSYTPYNIEEGSLYMYISLKADDFASQNMGGLVYFRQPSGTGITKQKTIKLFEIANNNFMCVDRRYNIGVASTNEWYNIIVKYDTFKDPDTTDKLSVYTVESFDDPVNAELTTIVKEYDTGIKNGIQLFRFGLDGAGNREIGQSWCFDNLCMYTTTDGQRKDVSGMGYGDVVDTEEAKTVNILSYSNAKSTAAYLSEAMIMKVGVDYALMNDKRAPIFDGEYGAPVKLDGQVYLPLEPIVDFLQYSRNMHADGISYDISNGETTTFVTVGREFASVNGTRVALTCAPAVYTDPDTNKSFTVIAMEDVEKLFPGYYVTWDDMGLIIISDYVKMGTDKNGNEIILTTDIVTREKNLKSMLALMKKFIFDYPTGEEVYADVKENTNGFTRPYLIATQDVFDSLHAAYLAKEGDEGYDANLKSQIEVVLNLAKGYYKSYSNIDGNGNYLGKKKEKSNPYDTEEYNYSGYRYDGRLNEPEEYGAEIVHLAIAYQITRDINYAKAGYDYLTDLANWKHWGPNHFLNCAGTAGVFALSLDWFYNVFEELGYDTYYLAERLYINGVVAGNNSNSYAMTANNWNAVCTAGTTLAALAILPYSVDNGYPECAEWEEVRNELLKKNLYNLANYGMNEYIPDGSYPEGPGYWSYATNNIFKMAAALDSAAGDNYGYMDTWGFDTTCYYALHAETAHGQASRPYQLWNYHDGDYGGQDTTMFNYVSRYYGDKGLAEIRSVQIANGKQASIYDLLFYQTVDPNAKVNIPLDYHMESIDGAVSRASWEMGALYAGIIGGANNASHGDIDSGTFIYQIDGCRWFYDFGSENYNSANYFNYENGRFNYFRKNAEGQNVLFMTSMQSEIPYGQVRTASGKVTSWKSNKYGSATVIDNTEVYGGYALSAKRGMLVTNDRTTVVIQDEVTLNSMQRLVWTGLTRGCAITIGRDGRTAYMTNGGRFLRVTLISSNESLRFSTKDCVNPSNYYLDCTLPVDSHTTLGGQPQYGRSDYTRLIIDAGMCIQFNVAVVIEYLGNSMQNAPDVGYSWINMNLWEPVESYEATETGAPDKVIKANIIDYAAKLDAYSRDGTAYSEKLSEYYEMLVKIDKIMLAFAPSELTKDQLTAYEMWLEHSEDYDSFKDFVSTQNASVRKIAGAMMGIK